MKIVLLFGFAGSCDIIIFLKGSIQPVEMLAVFITLSILSLSGSLLC